MRMRFSCSLLKARKLIGRIPVKYQLTGKSHLTYQFYSKHVQANTYNLRVVHTFLTVYFYEFNKYGGWVKLQPNISELYL